MRAAMNGGNDKMGRRTRWIRRREFVRRQLRRLRLDVVGESHTNNGWGTSAYRYQAVSGICIEVPEVGWLKLWRLYPEVLVNEAEFDHLDRLRRLLAPLLPPNERPTAKAPALEAPPQCWDADGYPIRLPGTDAILAMVPPPAPKVYENPKTLRHMRNRLKALGYEIRSIQLLGHEYWRIELERGPAIHFREGGGVSLEWGRRDYRLERLFKISK